MRTRAGEKPFTRCGGRWIAAVCGLFHFLRSKLTNFVIKKTQKNHFFFIYLMGTRTIGTRTKAPPFLLLSHSAYLLKEKLPCYYTGPWGVRLYSPLRRKSRLILLGATPVWWDSCLIKYQGTKWSKAAMQNLGNVLTASAYLRTLLKRYHYDSFFT